MAGFVGVQAGRMHWRATGCAGALQCYGLILSSSLHRRVGFWGLVLGYVTLPVFVQLRSVGK